ncbi:malonate decarboxylase holo-ACP synthase [Mycolicibacterium sp. CH28]|uniref:malonate decarboxylase holo-ACP synthase n=1 Tax=Mycolicibacterium sp. CH28 TaxID=2512237 RepID=UPI0010808C99|nr:malonate decarboxylase holo-ACP synthase [Mycolicibacterium sp. CH28]TGD86726.1 malonate decarboxylase holo-ACP synthase [Mycolicibacterium sp. CH28]
MIPRAHDLVRITREMTALPTGAPAWVCAAITAIPWVVVRRALAVDGHIPVGVRGDTRAHRYAMTLPRAAVVEIVTPEQLARVDLSVHRRQPATDTLALLRPELEETGLAWGPTGSVGFELATGVHTMHRDSDLDLVLRLDTFTPVALQQLSNIHERLAALPTRVDVQVETAVGAVALAEVVSGVPQLLARGPAGPQLVDLVDIMR